MKLQKRLIGKIVAVCVAVCMLFSVCAASITVSAGDSDNLALGADVTCDSGIFEDYSASCLTDGNTAWGEVGDRHTMLVRDVVSFTITLDLGTVKTFNRLTLVPSADGPNRFVGAFTMEAAGEDGNYQTVKSFAAPATPTDQTPVNFDIYAGVTARYVKLTIATCYVELRNECRIAELELHYVEGMVPPLTNLALGADVTCDDAHQNFPASNLTDGDYSFEGHSLVVQPENEFVIDVDLGKVKTFNRLTIVPSKDNPGWYLPDIKLYAAGEDKTFTLVRDFGVQTAPTDQTPVNYDIYKGVTAQYVRLVVSSGWWTGQNHDSRIAELEIYNIPTNLALGADVTCDDARSDFPASGLVDGNTTFNDGHTMIVQRDTPKEFSIDIDLGAVKTFNCLSLVPSVNDPDRFIPDMTVSVSTDGEDFKTVKAFSGLTAPADQTPVTRALPVQTARYVRLTVSKAWAVANWWGGVGGYDSRIAELELYYRDDLTETIDAPEAVIEHTRNGVFNGLVNNKSGLRFYQSVTLNADGTATVDGTTYQVLDMYGLVTTEAYLQANGLTADGLTAELANSTKQVQMVQISNYTEEDGTRDFSLYLINIPQSYREANIVARTWLLCQNADGQNVIVYGETATQSIKGEYDDIKEANGSNPFSDELTEWMEAELA